MPWPPLNGVYPDHVEESNEEPPKIDVNGQVSSPSQSVSPKPATNVDQEPVANGTEQPMETEIVNAAAPAKTALEQLMADDAALQRLVKVESSLKIGDMIAFKVFTPSLEISKCIIALIDEVHVEDDAGPTNLDFHITIDILCMFHSEQYTILESIFHMPTNTMSFTFLQLAEKIFST